MLRVQLRQECPVLGSTLLELVSSDPLGPRPRPSVETEPPRSNPSSRLSRILLRRSLGRPGRSILFPRSSGVDRPVPCFLSLEFSLLETHVGGHSLLRVCAGELEHRLVESVESCKRDELELVSEGR